MANIFEVDRKNDEIILGVSSTTINAPPLTASRLLSTDASKNLESVSDLCNWIAGTSNRITVADDGDGTVTLSAPQDIHTAASPTFAGLTVGDITFANGAGLAFGEIYYTGAGFTTTLAIQNTYYQILGFDTNGQSNDTTPDHTNDHITITKTGKYIVQCSVASRSATATSARVYQFSVKKNNGGTSLSNIMIHRTTSTADRVTTGACTGIVSLTANDTIELWVQRTDGGAASKTITLEHVVLNIIQIGG